MDFAKEIKPYTVRAVYECLQDNNCITHIAVVADYPGVVVPRDYVNEEGKIVLNVAGEAVANLVMGNEAITFNARFNGQPMDIYVPVNSVLAVFDRDTGIGQAWNVVVPPPASDYEGDELSDHAITPRNPELDRKGNSKSSKVTHLRVVK